MNYLLLLLTSAFVLSSQCMDPLLKQSIRDSHCNMEAIRALQEAFAAYEKRYGEVKKSYNPIIARLDGTILLPAYFSLLIKFDDSDASLELKKSE